MQQLNIYEHARAEKQPFVPIEPGRVRMYVCGMTVYDYCHVGHARVMVAFDVVQRWLRKASGYDVTYVRNITDIDDKIIRRAVENGESDRRADRPLHPDAMHEDADALGIVATRPRAARHRLHAADAVADRARSSGNGLAYRASRRRRELRRCASFPGYGKLSPASRSTTCAPASAWPRTTPRTTRSTSCCGSAPSPASPPETKWTLSWTAADRAGTSSARPWRCTLLGEHFDIHGGGADLQFPHHENEIAQSEGAPAASRSPTCGCTTASCSVNDEKMSKSLGNFFTIREVL